MKKFQSLIVATVVLSFSIAAFGAEPKNEPATIGTAEMKADGTIVLRLRAELPGGGSGEGELVYQPTHPEYKKILEHVVPSLPVRPFWCVPGQRPSSSPSPDFGDRSFPRLIQFNPVNPVQLRFG